MWKSILIIGVLATSMSVIASNLPFGERSLMSDTNIAERVERAGAVCLAGEKCAGQVAGPVVVEEVVEVAAGPRAGSAVYNSYCAGCHMTGAAGAPKVGEGQGDVWTKRLDARGGAEGLWQQAWKGIGAMPPKGMCMDCSEEEFAGAVAYMVEASQ